MYSDIRADISANDLKEKLQEEFETGTLSVERGGACDGYFWTITFIGIGGNKEEMVVDGSSLVGPGVKHKITTSADGKLFMGPAPMEYFRVPEKKPQVRILIV